jgi:hypothetical protein
VLYAAAFSATGPARRLILKGLGRKYCPGNQRFGAGRDKTKSQKERALLSEKESQLL